VVGKYLASLLIGMVCRISKVPIRNLFRQASHSNGRDEQQQDPGRQLKEFVQAGVAIREDVGFGIQITGDRLTTGRQ